MAEPSGPGVILGDDGRVLTVVGACAWVMDQAVGSWPCINTFDLVRMRKAERAVAKNVALCTPREGPHGKALLVSLGSCVCMSVFFVLCETNQR